MVHNKSSNIAMRGFEKVHHNSHSSHNEAMTLEGTFNKTLVLLMILTLSAFVGWTFDLGVNLMILVIASFVISLIIAIVLAFKPLLAKYLAPAYAIFEGYFLGVISMFFNQMYPGIVFQATLLTIGIAFLMNILYRNEIIKVTEKFKAVMMMAIFGIFGVYMVSLIMNIFLGAGIPLIHESGLIGIGFSLFVVTIASLTLLLDFDFIDNQVQHKAVKDLEWYGAFALIVTLVWIYIEVLKLLAKLGNRD